MDLRHILVPIALFACVVIVIIAILNFFLKMRILKSGEKDEEYIKLLRETLEYRSSPLKWGLILLFGGIGLVVITYIPQVPASLPTGVIAIFLSLGFLIYYLIIRKEGR